MKNIFSLLCVGLACILTACETILPVNIPEEEKWGITLNAVASPDACFRAYVTHCYPNTEAPEYDYPKYSYEDNWESDPLYHYNYSMLFNIRDDAPFNLKENYNLIKSSTLANAEVELTVNGKDVYPMEYDTLMLCFQSNYTPAIGDRLEVRVNNLTGGQTVARTEVPRPQRLEILEVESERLEKQEYIKEPSYLGPNKGYVKMKLRLSDPAEEKNYYRLVVRGIEDQIKNNPQMTHYIWDIFQSSAPIFRDERLTSNWDVWPAYFSNVFDDTLINGESYEFEVKTYALGVTYDDLWPTYEVSLQSITEDYYRYLKSLQLYKISTLNTTFSEGVYIHSNNEGGWGLLGGISGEVHRVEPFKGMNESSEGNGSPTN